jgi:hypothetical protein
MCPVSEVLVETLRSESLHARYGAVKALRQIGPSIIGSVSPLITSPRESDRTRLSGLEAIKPFYSCISENDLFAFSSILTEPHTAALKIEVIKLLKLCRHVPALPAIRACLDDDTVDERIQSWGFDDEAHQVAAYASDAISAIERIA